MRRAEEFYDKRSLSKNIIKDKAGLPDGAKWVMAQICLLINIYSTICSVFRLD